MWGPGLSWAGSLLQHAGRRARHAFHRDAIDPEPTPTTAGP